MKNLLALIGLAVVAVAGLGWHQGWYKIGSDRAPDGHSTIKVEVDPSKIVKDVKEGEHKIHDALAKKGGHEVAAKDLPVLPPAPVPALPASNTQGSSGTLPVITVPRPSEFGPGN